MVSVRDTFCTRSYSKGSATHLLDERLGLACRWLDGFMKVPDPNEVMRQIPGPAGPMEAPLGCVQLEVIDTKATTRATSKPRGWYRRTDLSGHRDEGPKLGVALAQSCPEMTISHEYFHFIQFELLERCVVRRDGVSPNLIQDQLDRIFSFIRRDRAYARWEEVIAHVSARHEVLRGNPNSTSFEVNKSEELLQFCLYIAERDEWLARTYSHFVAARYYWWGRRWFSKLHRKNHLRTQEYIKETDFRFSIGRRLARRRPYAGWVTRQHFKREFRELMAQMGWSQK